MLFGGGYDGSTASRVVDIYDSITGLWSTARLSAARYDLAAASVGTKALFAGGFTGGYSRVVDIYDASSNTWSNATLSQARSNLVAASLGSKVFFAGGQFNGPSITYSDVIDIYDDLTGLWTNATLRQARSSLAVVSLESKMFFAGGEFDSSMVDIYADLSITSPPATEFTGSTATDIITGSTVTNVQSYATLTTPAATIDVSTTPLLTAPTSLLVSCVGAPPTPEFLCLSGTWVARASIQLPIGRINISSLCNITGDLRSQNGTTLAISIVGSGTIPLIYVSGKFLGFHAFLYHSAHFFLPADLLAYRIGRSYWVGA